MEHELLLVKIQYFTTSITLGISLLHLVLYFYWPERRSNLFYALFLLFLGTAIFADFQQLVITGPEFEFYLRLHRAAMTFSLAAGLLFFYELFRFDFSSYFLLLAGMVFSAGIAAVLLPHQNFVYLEIGAILILVEIVRITYRAVRNMTEGAWIIGLGFLAFALFAGYDLLLDAGLISPLAGLGNAYQFGVLGLIGATSVYLARDISKTNERLLEQEKSLVREQVERELLEKEVSRTTRELEDARKLQLSMLPDSLPQMPTLEMAVHMRTAVEVGGDYYDFHKRDQNDLTVLVGDATGHGNKAGFMVAIIKSLFKSYKPKTDFPEFFENVTAICKKMNLGTLFMSLTGVHIDGRNVTYSAAGMPPLLVYRNSTGAVEEYRIKSMPLGAVTGFPYRKQKISLRNNDTLLLLSDGLQELFNQEHEMFGWQRVVNLFEDHGHLAPQELIDTLNGETDRWRGEKPIDDDITMVVLKYKAD